jgi:hypothetical protein
MKNTLILITSFILFSPNFFAQKIIFDEQALLPFEGLKNSSIAVGKINKDKFIDILVSGVNQNGDYITKLYINNQGNPGTFVEDKTNIFESGPNSEVYLADLNNDKHLDIVVNCDGVVHIYFNKKNGAKFLKSKLEIKSKEDYSKVFLSFGDIDNDGDMDIITYSILEKAFKLPVMFKLYINNGKGEFSSKTINLPQFTDIKQLEIADINSDQNNDIVLLATKDETIFDKGEKIYTCINNGDGTFIEKENESFLTIKGGAFKLFGLAWQGQWDIFITGSYENDQVSYLYSNDGKGNYSTSPLFQPGGVTNGGIAIGAFDDNIGDDFLMIGQYKTTLFLYSNNQHYRYMKQADIPFEKIVKYGSLVVEDFNGDNLEDVLILGENADGFLFSKLYLCKKK